MEKTRPENVGSYIAGCAAEARPKLEEIREIIKSAVPEAAETIWYGVPFYRYHGELAGFAAYKKHVSFGFGAGVLSSKDRKMLQDKGYKTGKGTLQIRFDQEAPVSVINRILKAKAEMNKAGKGTL